MRFYFPILLMLFLILNACSTLNLSPAEYAWPLETVLDIDENGYVKSDRYSLSFNAKDLFLEEYQDSLGYKNKQLRIISDRLGYYFITGNGFKHVYVFAREEGRLDLESKIFISNEGLSDPAMNQRNPYIELISKNFKYYLTKDGIARTE